MNQRRVCAEYGEEEVEKPIAISDYTEHMGALDRADHYCASYSFSLQDTEMVEEDFLLATGGVSGEFFHPV